MHEAEDLLAVEGRVQGGVVDDRAVIFPGGNHKTRVAVVLQEPLVELAGLAGQGPQLFLARTTRNGGMPGLTCQKGEASALFTFRNTQPTRARVTFQ